MAPGSARLGLVVSRPQRTWPGPPPSGLGLVAPGTWCMCTGHEPLPCLAWAKPAAAREWGNRIRRAAARRGRGVIRPLAQHRRAVRMRSFHAGFSEVPPRTPSCSLCHSPHRPHWQAFRAAAATVCRRIYGSSYMATRRRDWHSTHAACTKRNNEHMCKLHIHDPFSDHTLTSL